MMGTLNRAMEESSEPQLDAKSKVTNQLIDFQWKLGMAVSSDSCRSLKYPYVAVMLKVADHSGQVKNKSFEMTIPQFQCIPKPGDKQASLCYRNDDPSWGLTFWLAPLQETSFLPLTFVSSSDPPCWEFSVHFTPCQHTRRSCAQFDPLKTGREAPRVLSVSTKSDGTVTGTKERKNTEDCGQEFQVSEEQGRMPDLKYVA
ncbi:hypothetical protein JEQ12_002205 [Ovis aries]|uniref:COMM domain-containing protein 6 n=1 Tax=Ovis aries TaxID=9940 RepID=A0A836D2C6_SHEEP|nr:hypothetical protein JEQ12_002205 [Ovis aries]